MNLKKIIQEEIDDLSWMDSISPNPFMMGDYHVIWFDRGVTEEEAKELLQVANEAGFYAYFGDGTIRSEVTVDIRTISEYSKGDEGYLRLYKETLDNKSTYSYGNHRRVFEEMSDPDQQYQPHNVSDILPNLKESVDYYLDRMVESCLMLNEVRKPDMVWDFHDIKQNIDKSKEDITTRGEIISYLEKFFKKIKRIPTQTKKKIIKYVLISFLGLMSIQQMVKIVNQVSDEPISVKVTPEKKLMVSFETPNGVEYVRPSKPTEKLVNFIKDEEKLMTTAYDIGDGHITIGYGHAEREGETDLVAGQTTISKGRAEQLLRQDIQTQTNYLNRILRQWDERGINPKINQNMYDAMISLMFNIGYGNFRQADFVQDIKKGDFKTAEEKIKTTHISYLGHKPRRKKESAMFGS